MMDFFEDYVIPIFITIFLIFAIIALGIMFYYGFKDGFTTQTIIIKTQEQENITEVK